VNTGTDLLASVNTSTDLTASVKVILACRDPARGEETAKQLEQYGKVNILTVPNHDGGRPMEVNACILITHMVYL
jgi:translation initiation factor 2B subunit (eIF-2B alpha/beta/delta family)